MHQNMPRPVSDPLLCVRPIVGGGVEWLRAFGGAALLSGARVACPTQWVIIPSLPRRLCQVIWTSDLQCKIFR